MGNCCSGVEDWGFFSFKSLESGGYAKEFIHMVSTSLSDWGDQHPPFQFLGKLGSHLVQFFQWPAYTIDCLILAVTLPIFEGLQYIASIPILLAMGLTNVFIPLYTIEWVCVGPERDWSDGMRKFGRTMEIVRGVVTFLFAAFALTHLVLRLRAPV